MCVNARNNTAKKYNYEVLSAVNAKETLKKKHSIIVFSQSTEIVLFSTTKRISKTVV